MILADTSVWVEHLRRGLPRLAALLEDGEVSSHVFVIGELALGRLAPRTEILTLLSNLPRVDPAEHDEVLSFVEHHGLSGRGIGWVDAHLLASAALGRTALWTLDRRLAAVGADLDLLASSGC